MTPRTQVERRLELLKAEIGLDFSGLVEKLENGIQVAMVTSLEIGKTLEPDALRRIGGLVMLCNHYGVVVMFANEDRLHEICYAVLPKT